MCCFLALCLTFCFFVFMLEAFPIFRRLSTLTKHLRGCLLAGLLACSMPWTLAADIYASVGADGTTRWATQALDASYEKVMVESAPVVIAAAPLVQAAPPYAHAPAQRPRNARSVALSPLIHQAALRYGLEPGMLMALVEVESGFNPKAISPKGARGLMQLMPSTAARYGMRDVRELHDPARNLDIGARHLKDLLVLHRGQWALAMAAYNAGQGAVAKHGQRIPSYKETMLYVPSVLAIAARNAPLSEYTE
jgi:soluble lytic murein transglycosylase-like protein